MGVVEIQPRFVFVGHGYVQHACSEWRGEQSTCYHSYLLPESHDLLDVVALAYEQSITYGGRKALPSVEGRLDPQVGDSDEQPHMKHWSSKSESSDSRLSTFVLEAENVPENK